ncbi:RagB/SusD family nutrient uptake outer membrane protein [Flavitalea sp. BT771]|uniref:RagB/SusD family nutrient uptake outer membrane protein n=1 Tax=Flavitalea sp. BT771 TaxID=3063329 RepID=UPI0026E2D5C6|nr:RagB/SusD family nutrient uptake outer membrane protein [Flavitalea sp. BT771]MDO6433027.1 RagB/SusD family nutrient uptake outer membrane protein [Flavitalea sp. BT771]MDV6221697.1 RagB/SusD family nutrient uptake outer membrane protein [Flavitalea sp. BT771]
MLKKYMVWAMITGMLLPGCRKFVQVGDPETSLGTATVFSGDETATAALMGMYSRAMTAQGSFLNGGNSLYPALSADECALTQASPGLEAFRDNALASNNTYIAQLYSSAYNTIYNANMLLENVDRSKQKLSTSVWRQIKGEALFVRALVYSRLVVLWGGVPRVITTNADDNATKGGSVPDSIYSQVIGDLQGADSLLDITYAWAGSGPPERTRPNRWAAKALAARIWLTMGHWVEVEAAATAVIESGDYQLEASPDSVFLKGSREAILQFQPVGNSINSAEGYSYLPADNPLAKPAFVLDPVLLAAFEPQDIRLPHWVGTKIINGVTYAYPAKYKVRAAFPYREYEMVIRLAEVLLIRAEARAQQGRLDDAISDLNRIRSRAGLADLLTGVPQTDILAAIAQERRIELFTEWGHRWADLKRWGQADVILAAEKAGWKPYAKLYPFPLSDVLRNLNLTQNDGY